VLYDNRHIGHIQREDNSGARGDSYWRYVPEKHTIGELFHAEGTTVRQVKDTLIRQGDILVRWLHGNRTSILNLLTGF